MSRRAALITQADVARALRAAEQVAPGRCIVEISPSGCIRIMPIGAAKNTNADADAPFPPDEGQNDPFARGLGIVP